MSEKREFLGCAPRAAMIAAIRASIYETSQKTKFDITAIQNLPQFDRATFAKWVQKLHCEELDDGVLTTVQAYLVNYFLLPEGDEFDVEAMRQDVFGSLSSSRPAMQPVVRIGNWVLCKDVQP